MHIQKTKTQAIPIQKVFSMTSSQTLISDHDRIGKEMIKADQDGQDDQDDHDDQAEQDYQDDCDDQR